MCCISFLDQDQHATDGEFSFNGNSRWKCTCRQVVKDSYSRSIKSHEEIIINFYINELELLFELCKWKHSGFLSLFLLKMKVEMQKRLKAFIKVWKMIEKVEGHNFVGSSIRLVRLGILKMVRLRKPSLNPS